MSTRIKGITIELDGDATKLDKAVQGVEKNLRGTQTALKDVNRLLKLDPTNTELLSQKQKLLQTSIYETKNKLDVLKEADKQAKAQLEAGDLGKEKYDALQREIIETEKQLKELESTVGSGSAKFAEISAKTGEFGEKTTEAGEKLLPATAAIAGLAGAAVKTAADFDSSMSNVQAISGATADDMDKLREKAREMGEKTKFSATEAGDAMSYMAMAGWKTKDMVDGIDGIMNLAAASGEDLATTSDIVTDALTAFGMSAEESGSLADIMAAASSNANTNVSLLGESFKYCAPLFGAMNYSAEDASVALGLMANAGIKGSQAGTSLKTAITNMVKPTDKMAMVMDKYGLSLTNADGSMKTFSEVMEMLRDKMGGLSETQQASAAATLFGKEAMAGMLSIINAAPADYEKLTTAVDGAEGSAKKMADTMNDNLAGKLTILKSQLQELGISIGEILMPYIEKAVEFIQKLVDKFNGMSEGQKKAVVAVGGIIAALGPLLIIIGKVSTGISAVTGLLSKASGVGKIGTLLTGLGGKISAVVGTITAALGPVGLIIAAVAGVAAGLVLLYNKCEWFREGVNAVWESVKSAFSACWDGIVAFFTETLPQTWTTVVEFFQGIPEWWAGIWQGVGDFFAGIWQGICSFFTETIPAAWQSAVAWFQGIPEWWAGIWQQVSDFFTNIWTTMMQNPVISGIATTIQTLWQNLVATLQGIWTGLTEIASGAWELLKNTILGPVLLLIDLVTGNFTKLKEDAANIWTNIQNAASTIWNGIKTVVTSLVQGLVTHVVTLVTGFKDTLANLWEVVKNAASTAWDNLKNAVVTAATNLKESAVQVVTNLKESVAQAWENMKASASEAWQNIKQFVIDTAQDLKQSAVDAFNNLVSGIGDALSNLGGVVSDGFQAAINFITALPSQAVEWGKDFIQGIVDGINSAIGWITDAVSNVAETIRSFLHFSVPDEGPLTDYESWMPDFMQGLAKGIEKSKSVVANAIAGVSKDMTISANAMVERSGSEQNGAIMSIVSILAQYLPYLAAGKNLYFDKGEWAGVLAPEMNTALNEIAAKGEYL